MTEKNEFPNRLRFWRKKRAMTLTDAAPRLNLSRGHLSNLETGTRELSVPVLERAANAFDCKATDLLSHEHGALTIIEREIIDAYRTCGDDVALALEAVAFCKRS